MIRLSLVPVLALLVAAPAAGQDDLASIEKDFKAALALQAEKPLETAVRSLLKLNSAAAVKVMLPHLKAKVDVNIYWTLVRGSASFSSPEALAEVTKYILDNKSSGLARDLAAALHGNFGEGIEEALIALLEKGTSEIAILAVEHMQDVGTKRTVDVVLNELAKPPATKDLERRLFSVLRCLLDADYGESLSNWQGWWTANREKDWSLLKAKPKGMRGTGTVADGLKTEYERLREGKILVLGAGDKCRCKKNHDLDNIDQIIRKMGLQVDKVDKVQFAKPEVKPDDYIAICVNCTFIESHCVCPTCKPGGASDLRRFQ